MPAPYVEFMYSNGITAVDPVGGRTVQQIVDSCKSQDIITGFRFYFGSETGKGPWCYINARVLSYDQALAEDPNLARIIAERRDQFPEGTLVWPRRGPLQYLSERPITLRIASI